jgi:UDP-glucose 4-epimerase
MARLLITGASGFIGSYLAQSLSRAQHHVTAGARRPSPDLQGVLPNCHLIALDVLQGMQAVEGEWDCILHTATANDILSRDFRAGIELSAVGTQNLLEMAHRLGVPHVIFFSTLQVYGTELNGEVNEETPVQLQNQYGLNHYAGELTCQLFSRLHRVKTSVVRPANVYGCPVSPTVDRWSLVPMCFVKEALASASITLRSSGLQRRDFVSLRQVSEACAHLIAQPPELSGVFNIASGETWNMLDAARWVREAYTLARGSLIDVRVLSEIPAQANDFRVHSAITPPPLGGSSAEEMSAEIAKMFEFFGKPAT